MFRATAIFMRFMFFSYSVVMVGLSAVLGFRNTLLGENHHPLLVLAMIFFGMVMAEISYRLDRFAKALQRNGPRLDPPIMKRGAKRF